MTALFSKEESKKESSKDAVKPAKKSSAKKTAKKSALPKGVPGRTLSAAVLENPLITEKAHNLLSLNKYAFFVDTSATKMAVRRSIEELYGVTVIKIAIIREKSIRKMRGRTVGKTKARKKAIITLKKGDSIPLFQGA